MTRKPVFIGALLFPLLAALTGVAGAGSETVSRTVRLNEKAMILEYWLLNAVVEKADNKCVPFRPATLILKKKPKIGKVRIRKGVMINSGPNTPCKGKKVRGSTVEYTGTERGRETFVIEIIYRQAGYYDERIGEIRYNIQVI